MNLPRNLPKQTHYDILQVPPTATSEEIKFAYRALIVRCHPDKLPQSSQNFETNEDVGCEKRSVDVQLLNEGLSAIDLDDDDDDGIDQCECTNGDENREESSAISNDQHLHLSLQTGTHTTKPQTTSQMNNEPNTSSDVPLNTHENEAATTEATNASFIQIQEAYKCLRDSSARRQYDESLSRRTEREEWKYKGALEVDLSELEWELCHIVDDDDDDYDYDESNTDETDNDNNNDCEESQTSQQQLQKVYFHPCRCGDTFQIMQEELVESIDNSEAAATNEVKNLTNRVWQCESCSLAVRIHFDVDLA